MQTYLSIDIQKLFSKRDLQLCRGNIVLVFLRLRLQGQPSKDHFYVIVVIVCCFGEIAHCVLFLHSNQSSQSSHSNQSSQAYAAFLYSFYCLVTSTILFLRYSPLPWQLWVVPWLMDFLLWFVSSQHFSATILFPKPEGRTLRNSAPCTDEKWW